MLGNLIFWPLLANLLLAILLYFKLIAAKKRAAAEGRVDESRRALHEDAWPDDVLQVNNCIRNQFEVPVLFYVVVAIIYGLGAVNWVALSLAWTFVVSRYFHAYIHTGSNVVSKRRRFFSIGVVTVLVMVLYATWLLMLGSG